MLDKRLLAAANFVRKNSLAVDVGTDHGYLAVYLIENGIAKECIASDVNEKPLQSAAATIKKHNLGDRIKTVLSDGLLDIPKEKAEDIIICGMGGELISKIILDCPYSEEEKRHFVLQPMTNVPFLRKSLCQNGFFIEKEDLLSENGHDYTVMSVYFGGEEICLTELQAVVGKIPQSESRYKQEYLNHLYNKYKKIEEGLLKSKGNEKMLSENSEILSGLQKIIKEFC